MMDPVRVLASFGGADDLDNPETSVQAESYPSVPMLPSVAWVDLVPTCFVSRGCVVS